MASADDRSIDARAAAMHTATTRRMRRVRIAFALGSLALLGFGVFVVVRRITSAPAARAPAGEVSATRQGQIDGLRARLAARPCEAVSGELLVKQLIAAGQRAEAVRFGTDFLARCGDNPFIRGQLAAPAVPARL